MTAQREEWRRATERAERAEGLVAAGLEAFRLTNEYLGDEVLPPVLGWTWFDWTVAAAKSLSPDEETK